MYMLVCWCDEKSLALLWEYLKIYTHHYVVHRFTASHELCTAIIKPMGQRLSSFYDPVSWAPISYFSKKYFSCIKTPFNGRSNFYQ